MSMKLQSELKHKPILLRDIPDDIAETIIDYQSDAEKRLKKNISKTMALFAMVRFFKQNYKENEKP